MKNLFYVLALSLLFSCTYNDIARPVCYLQSELLNGAVHSYGYNDRNQLVSDSYPGDQAVMGYDVHGNIITESDFPDVQISYTYDDKHELTQMDGSSATYPLAYTWRTKYAYNSGGQLVRIESWLFNGTSLYLARYETLEYSSANTRNYSVRKLYNASDVLLQVVEFQWDNHPNPHLRNPYFTNEPPPTNNITSATITQGGGNPYVYSYTYIYNSKGFPSKLIYNGTIINAYTYTNCD
ncbi:MAG TPA: hypothetical protein VL728_12655 [Cyclobacteriaceae bacterium]|nr:hypothetical protein [Cyclobacteriaceae bacterium]